jgi:DMSO/TMAO reductase YedYZ molybdopterin-dependent catalytic subunit
MIAAQFSGVILMQRLSGGRKRFSRRQFLGGVGGLGVAGAIGGALGGVIGGAAWAGTAEPSVMLPFANGKRDLVANYPQKGAMILQRTRPPLLETPFEVFDQGVFTPNDRFYVRWHLATIPTIVDPAAFRLKVRGSVQTPLELTLDDLVRRFKPIQMAAVNQCSGNSRGFFKPRVPGGQWGNGAMGNALWTGVSLKDVLDRAGVKADAIQVRFNGMDNGLLPQTPDFLKSLGIDHSRDGEVMIAYAMNGEPLPLLNGFPLRLIVPGWFATYWVKMLDDIEVLASPDENFWMTKAYLIPDTPFADITPGQQGVKSVPINRMVPRSFITNLKDGATLELGESKTVRGIAFGGDAGVAGVSFSADGGASWQDAQLGPDRGKYGFRQWEAPLWLSSPGVRKLLVKAVNTAGVSQPDRANWNGGGFLRNVVESVSVRVT